MPEKPRSTRPPAGPPSDEWGTRLYGELRHLAEGYMRERQGHTLQPTALVHEAWVRMSEASALEVADEEHFLALAATLMRQVLVEHARGKAALKRGGGWQRVSLGDAVPGEKPFEVDVLALDEALGKLAQLNPERARLVELRYFAGLSGEKAAVVLGISRSEAARRWRLVKAWLANELRTGGPR